MIISIYTNLSVRHVSQEAQRLFRHRLSGTFKDCQTLFDATEGLQSSPHEEQIFNGITFCHPFIKKLKASRQSIVISSP